MKSWRTTVVGCALAMSIAIYEPMQTGEVNWSLVLVGALVAGLSFLVKDSNVTGVGSDAMSKKEIEDSKRY